ncbi:MAG TPA: response regulator [Opitutaceae bacterium]|nr:response regulator [Opitutaceae bacterium]
MTADIEPLANISDSSPILVIDDDRSSLLLLEYLFKSIGLGGQVKTALGSEIGLKLLQERARNHGNCPTLIILDVEMPHIDGFGLLTWIHEHFCTTRPTTVMMSASQAPQHVRHAAELNADGYFVKFPAASTLREIYELAQRIHAGDECARTRLLSHPGALRPSA